MLNPYEPPTDLQRAPYWKRFRAALRRAAREYKAGLVRDKISTTEHVTTWFSAISAGCIVLFVVACLVINLVRHYGSWF